MYHLQHVKNLSQFIQIPNRFISTMNSISFSSATSQVETFIATCPAVQCEVVGFKRNQYDDSFPEKIFIIEFAIPVEFFVRETAKSETIKIKQKQNFKDSTQTVVEDEKTIDIEEDDEFYRWLKESASKYDTDTKSAYKTFNLYKAANMPHAPFKSLVEQRIRQLIPHFSHNSQSYVKVMLKNTVEELNLQGGRRSKCGSCTDHCCTPCLSNTQATIWLSVLGCFGLCALWMTCNRKKDCSPKFKTSIQFIPSEQANWEQLINENIQYEQLQHVKF